MTRKILNLEGHRFGMLVPIKPDHKGTKRGWLCQCDCGNEKFYPTFQLTKGETKSCGCLTKKKFSLIGKRFGMLEVTAEAQKLKAGRPRWICKCDCGGEHIVESKHLNNGTSTHCGCQTKLKMQETRRKLPPGTALAHRVLDTYKRNAKIRGYEWQITDEKAFELFKGDCFYCGAPPSTVRTHPKHHGDFIYNGIDRSNNTIGYLVDNVQSCCKKCNYFKNHFSHDEFVEHMKKILKHIKEI